MDAGEITLSHVTVHSTWARASRTAVKLFLERSRLDIRKTIPAKELTSVIDNIGLPTSAINMIYNNTGLIGEQDGDIYI